MVAPSNANIAHWFGVGQIQIKLATVTDKIVPKKFTINRILSGGSVSLRRLMYIVSSPIDTAEPNA